jgi:hypothetical protein
VVASLIFAVINNDPTDYELITDEFEDVRL